LIFNLLDNDNLSVKIGNLEYEAGKDEVMDQDVDSFSNMGQLAQSIKPKSGSWPG